MFMHPTRADWVPQRGFWENSFSQPFMIVGGDFNLCMSPTKERFALFQTTPNLQVQKRSSSFWKLIWAHNMYDIWRLKHPTAKQFTFDSPPHKLYTRLNHFSVSAPLLTHVVNSDINPITWSNHTPIVLDLLLSAQPPENVTGASTNPSSTPLMSSSTYNKNWRNSFNSTRVQYLRPLLCGKPISLFSGVNVSPLHLVQSVTPPSNAPLF